MKPKVSVIIPTYNVEAYIEQALRSALDQTVQTIEVIIVDDASTDKTVSIIQGMKDPRIQITINEKNSGPSHSRNVAIQKAKGDWIALLDGDDWWENNRLQRMLEVAEAQQATIVADDIQNYAEGEKNPWNETQLGKWRHSSDKWVPSAADVVDYDLGPLKPLFQREFLVQKGLHYQEEITYGEDFVLLLECLLQGAKMVVFAEPLYIRRAWANSLTAHRQKSTESLIQLTKTYLTKLKGKDHDYRLVEKCPEVVQALERRLKRQTDAYLYHQLTEPFKTGNTLQAAFQMLGLIIRQPRGVVIMAKKVPAILDYRLLRHLRRSPATKEGKLCHDVQEGLKQD